MKYKLLAILMTVFMLSVPMIGFWHPVPPGPSCTTMATSINGTDPTKEYKFTEPVDGYCEDFTVDVLIYKVEDLYGYDIIVDFNAVLFNYVSIDIVDQPGWADQTTIFVDDYYTGGPPPTVGYVQFVVTALPPSVGLTGDFKLATLHFHIMNDVCPCENPAPFVFSLDAKLSNSCTGIIRQCDNSPMEAFGKFYPVIPEMWIEPAYISTSTVGEKNTISVMVKNAVKMEDFEVTIAWDMFFHADNPCGFWDGTAYIIPAYSQLLTCELDDIVLNPAFDATTATITLVTLPCGTYKNAPTQSWIYVAADILPDTDPINLTHPSQSMWLFNVTFTKCDPWYSGAQPLYTINTTTHLYEVGKACTDIYFKYAAITGPCPDVVWPDCVKVTDGEYCFKPIPGDLNGDGVVNTADLLIEADYYGLAGNCVLDPTWMPPNGFPYFYDLNHSGMIDIYDIVIVAKNFGATDP